MLPSPSATPAVFESEEEALAGSTQALRAFLDVSTQILADGGAAPERIDQVAASDLANDERESYVSFQTNNWHAVGTVNITGAKLGFWYRHPDAAGVVAQLLACLDYTAVDVLDTGGLSVVDPNRENVRAVSIEISLSKDARIADRSMLAISSKDSIDRAGVCP